MEEVSRKVSGYDSKIAALSQEIERLNGALRGKVDEVGSLEGKLQSVRQENEGLRRGGSESEYKITQITQEYSMKISTYENRIQQFSSENEDLQRRIHELDGASRKLSEYERRI